MDTENTPLKIIVTYHKPYPKSPFMEANPDLYVPILGGKDSTTAGIEPFLPGMLVDNIGDNISWINPYLNEITCLYWAWKHRKEIGNPIWIGSHHYRRFFKEEDIIPIWNNKIVINIEDECIPQHDGIKYFFGYGMEQQIVDIAQNSLLLGTSYIKKWFTEYMNLNYQYNRDMFICPWSIFDALMTYLTSMFPTVVPNIYYDYLLSVLYRNMSYLLERMIGFFFYCLEQSGIPLHKARCEYFCPEGY